MTETFNSAQQERLLAALDRIADALEKQTRPVQPTATITSDRPITADEAKRLHDVWAERARAAIRADDLNPRGPYA